MLSFFGCELPLLSEYVKIREGSTHAVKKKGLSNELC